MVASVLLGGKRHSVGKTTKSEKGVWYDYCAKNFRIGS